jgi:hypothetical protein
MDDYNLFGGHTYFGSPLGGLHTYQLTFSLYGTAYVTTWWHYLQKHHISKYLHRSYDRLCTSLLLRNKNSSKKKKKKNLNLRNIPPTGYISPEEIIACLAALPRLESFTIIFQLAIPRPDRMDPPPVTRTVLPALTTFEFQGAREYLEDLVARIDGPQLNKFLIRYLNQLGDFQVAQLRKFIDRSLGPKLNLFRHAHATFDGKWVSFHMYGGTEPYPDPFSHTFILCEGIDWQVSHIPQVLSQFTAIISNVVHLKLNVWRDKYLYSKGRDDVTVEWRHLLHRFSTVQTLHVHQELAAHVARALEDITGQMVAEVLPSLDLIYLAGRRASSVKRFVAARRLSGRPVTVVETETELEERLKSYVPN